LLLEHFGTFFHQIETEVAKIFSSKCDPDQMEEDMIRYLDENLQTLNSLLDSSTFDRILEHISQSVIHAMHNAICRDIEVSRRLFLDIREHFA
jgi:hypothetical protein